MTGGKAGEEVRTMTVIRPLLSELERVRFRLQQADRVLVAIDYDATVAPVAGTPAAAGVLDELRHALNRLSRSKRYVVAILSCHSPEELKRRLPLKAIYVGHHGFEIQGEDFSFVHERAGAIRETIHHAACDLVSSLHWASGVLVERQEYSATVRYARLPEALRGELKSSVERTLQSYGRQLVVIERPDSLEIRPRVRWNKAAAVGFLLARISSGSPALVCAGNDTTHEGMFSLMRWEISINVGTAKCTRARFYVNELSELFAFFRLLLPFRADVGTALSDEERPGARWNEAPQGLQEETTGHVRFGVASGFAS
jgi:trehalose 6-phosphate synthase/phosphatase